MSSEDLRKRLEALNRGPVPDPAKTKAEVGAIRRTLQKKFKKAEPAASKEAAPEPPQAILYRRDLPRVGPAAKPHAAPAGPPVVLEDAVPGTEVTVPNRGTAYEVTTTLADHEGDWQPLCDAFRSALAEGDPGLCPRLAEACDPSALAPDEMLFVDIETTGLSTSPLFLIGAMTWADGDFVIRQHLARTYAEEAAAVALFADDLADKRLLVSFNGKTFDLPYIRMRAAALRVPLRVDLAHFDLLHVSRRIWRGHVPNCRLQTLEQFICGRRRSGDIPGAEIPDAYHAFVRTGNARQIVDVLKHNLLDLVTMADLMTRLPAVAPEDEP